MFLDAKESSYQCTEEVNYQDDDFGNCLGRTCFFQYVLRNLYIFQMPVWVSVCLYTAKTHLMQMKD